MQQYALAPLLTERDLVNSDEGGINPLGTEALADALAGRLGEAGFDLLNVWAREQQLEGFAGSKRGPGKAVRAQLADALP